ncbi:MAG: hypothetical protein ACRDPZ_03940, partial [Gaiellaceae bacterium]
MQEVRRCVRYWSSSGQRRSRRPPSSLRSPTAPTAAQKDIAQVAGSSPQFSTLVSLLKKAGLVGALKKGNYTV